MPILFYYIFSGILNVSPAVRNLIIELGQLLRTGETNLL